MNYTLKLLGLVTFLSLLLCVVMGASAADDSAMNPQEPDSSAQAGNVSIPSDLSSMDIINNTALRDQVLSNLESNGVNTSVLRAAISVGAKGKVKNILEYYKDKIQINPASVPSEANADKPADVGENRNSAQKETPGPTGTTAPLSPFIALFGIAAAGCITFLHRR